MKQSTILYRPLPVVMAMVLMVWALDGVGAPVLDRQLLVGKKFEFGIMIGGTSIAFKADGTYVAQYSSEGRYWYNDGTYTITGGSVKLKPARCLSDEKGQPIECRETLGAATCVVEESSGDLYHARFLACRSPNKQPLGFGTDTIFYYRDDFKLPAGTERVWQGTPVVTMGQKFGATTTVVKIRKAPSVTAPEVPYLAELFGGEEKPAVPAGTEIAVIARTKNKQTVDKWINYWYLVNVGAREKVWMFGEFVKLK